MPIPKAILEAPTLRPEFVFYYQAFLKLSSCRPTGFDEGRIPWTAVAAYCEHYDFDDLETDLLWDIIVEIDNAYLDYRHKKAAPSDAIGKGKMAKKEPVVTRRGR